MVPHKARHFILCSNMAPLKGRHFILLLQHGATQGEALYTGLTMLEHGATQGETLYTFAPTWCHARGGTLYWAKFLFNMVRLMGSNAAAQNGHSSNMMPLKENDQSMYSINTLNVNLRTQ